MKGTNPENVGLKRPQRLRLSPQAASVHPPTVSGKSQHQLRLCQALIQPSVQSQEGATCVSRSDGVTWLRPCVCFQEKDAGSRSEKCPFLIRKCGYFLLFCPSVPSEESLVKTGGTNLGNMGCSTLPRFCFFHSFFEKKKPTSKIPETEQQFSFPMEGRAREVVSSAFFRWAVGSVGEV